MTTDAADYLYPPPRHIEQHDGSMPVPGAWTFSGNDLPRWLHDRLPTSPQGSSATLILRDESPDCSQLSEPHIAQQGYRLTLKADGNAELIALRPEGVRNGVVTLSQLLRAAADGATLRPMTITDAPMFEVRGIQVDLAREFFPTVKYLQHLIDRCVDLKYNTIWLYLENRFAAPGLEDMAGHGALRPEDARSLSAYGRERGLDVVPLTNVISHMEGWFRLERYADLADGPKRSYAVTTRPELWGLITQYLDALADAFDSPNFHAGLDELLLTGTNPEAARAIDEKGKPAYFADHAVKVIDYLQRKGKRVWMWDDMVQGINVMRPNGFAEQYKQALDRIPRDVVMTHWYYWTEQERDHGSIMHRVAAEGRPLAMAAGADGVNHEYPGVTSAAAALDHMADCARRHNATAFIQTHWSAVLGVPYETHWPLMALAAPFAWAGPCAVDDGMLDRLAFALTGRIHSGVAAYLKTLDALDQWCGRAMPALGGQLRKLLFRRGPDGLHQRISPELSPAMRREARQLLATAATQSQLLAGNDEDLLRAIRLPVTTYATALDVLDGFDAAWRHYHAASLIERDPAASKTFSREIEAAIAQLRDVRESIGRLRARLVDMEPMGHTPYDAILLDRWCQCLDATANVIDAAARESIGLPAFHKLLYPPDAAHLPNLDQYRLQYTSRPHRADYPWPRRHEPDDASVM